jgi:hypothetical protein
VLKRREGNRRPVVDRGGGAQVEPTTASSVPVILHDYYGPGRHAKIVSTHAKDFAALERQGTLRKEPPLTGEDSRVSEVTNVEFPAILDPVDDLPPATIITSPVRGVTARRSGGKLVVRGTTTDNVGTRRVVVNGVEARDVDYNFHQWEATLEGVKPGEIELQAHAEDTAGNVESNVHKLTVTVE